MRVRSAVVGIRGSVTDRSRPGAIYKTQSTTILERAEVEPSPYRSGVLQAGMGGVRERRGHEQ